MGYFTHSKLTVTNEYAMTTKERKKLKKIAKRIVIQSYRHTDNITEYYAIMVQAAREEFSEDNDITLDDFLGECFRIAVLRHTGECLRLRRVTSL